MAHPEMTGVLPDEVVLGKAEIARPRFTPRELRLIKEQTGHSLSELLSDEHSDDKFVVFGWLKLRRMGFDLEWPEMDDIVLSLDMGDPPPADPTNGQRPTT